MKISRFSPAAAAAAVLASALGAHAALAPGAAAPDFTAQAYLGGKAFTFNLNDALKKGPVVVYFFPAAFTNGCQIEAHLFAESADKFTAQGATIIGVTRGNLDRVGEFSADTRYCSGKFPMAADTDGSIAAKYDSSMAQRPGMTGRDSYVVGKDHKISLAYSNLDPTEHVDRTLAAVTALKSGK
jgi:peroxiredoxin